MAGEGLPIIYVRGYAGNQAAVETAVDDPFYGFNTGSTHVRVDGDGNPQFYEFEGPLLRLIDEHGYAVLVRGNQEALLVSAPAGSLQRRSVWIYRYYDEESGTFGTGPGKRLLIEEAAAGLRSQVDKVRAATGAPRVILVAHSMGGLICRSLLQKIYPPGKATDFVDRLFTYGTPHGGIHFAVGGGVIDWAMDKFGPHGSNTFGPDRMYAFLTPGQPPDATAPAGFEPRDLKGAFPPERVFCVVGTDPGDYGAAFGLSQRVVGPQSDGLVQIDNAYVLGAPRAYVHRSHSGRYGEVDSEEGYQNLQRFLFGDTKVTVWLKGVSLPADGASHQLELRLSLRGLPVVINEQLTSQYCPIMLDHRAPDIELFTTFLNSAKSATGNGTCRYALTLSMFGVREQRSGLFDFSKHLEQVPVWSRVLLVDVTPQGGGYRAVYGWSAQSDPTQSVGAGGEVALPADAQAPNVFGANAALFLQASAWS